MATKRKTNQKFDFAKREGTGKGVCRKIRSKNALPVVLYGPDFKDGLAGTVDAKAISAVANSPFHETTVVTLAMEDGKAYQALLRDIQRHPLTQQLRHIDFYEVVAGHKIKVEIPVHYINKDICKGVKEGGVIEFTTREVEIEVEPAQIPDEITIDTAEFELGTEIFVKDLQAPEGVTILTDPKTLVLHIITPRSVIEGEAEAEATEENKEVEVVAKGKKEEE